MGMDWANERYVRLYVRETPDQALWCWQALAVWPWLVMRAERSGELRTRKGAAGIAALIRMPIEVVEPGIADLLADGCLVETHRGYALPNYVEAQNATSSDSKRKADQRARERLDTTLNSNDSNIGVTPGHVQSRPVTTGHSEPIRSEPIRKEIEPKTAPLVLIGPSEPKPRKQPTGPHAEVVDCFNDHYRQAYGSGATWGDKQGAMVKGLLASHSVDKIRRHIANLFERPPAHLKPPFDLGTLVANFDKLADAPRAGGFVDRKKALT